MVCYEILNGKAGVLGALAKAAYCCIQTWKKCAYLCKSGVCVCVTTSASKPHCSVFRVFGIVHGCFL